MAEQKSKGGLLGSLDKLIGNDGLKTDLRISLSQDVYYNLGATIVISVGIVIILMTISKVLLKSKV